MSDTPITTQPGSSVVEVRKMVESDPEFLGDLFVEGFRPKFEWAVGKSNIPGAKRSETNIMKNVDASVRDKTLVATYQGKPAGFCALDFHGEGGYPHVDPGISEYMSCCPVCRLNCFKKMLYAPISKDECYVDHICVSSDVRGKGVGKALLDAADEEGRKRGCKNMMLIVADVNRAKNLYAREGYENVENLDGCCFTYCAMGYRRFIKMEKPL